MRIVRRRIDLVRLLVGLSLSSLPAFAAQDTTPPVLTGFTFSPSAVNVTTVAATVTVTAQATDNLSGVDYVYVAFASPSGAHGMGSNMYLISGSSLNGTFQCALEVQPYSEAGTWTVTDVTAVDNAGNAAVYYTDQLKTVGFPTTLQVTSIPDTTPPVLTAFSFSPSAVNVATAPATVTATAQATDNLSGVDYVYVAFASPSGAHDMGGNMYLISGSNLNGTFQGAIEVPPNSEAGTWTVTDVTALDNAGNSAIYYTSQLQTMGFPTSLQVTSIPDTTPPVLTGFTFSPSAVNVATAAATVTATAQATDNLSGVDYVYVAFASPSGAHDMGGNMYLISGSNLNGTFQCSLDVQPYSEAGTWTVTDVTAVDNAGNAAVYYTGQLQTMGFPTTLQVTDGTSVTLSSSANPAAYLQPVTFSASVASATGTTPTGTVNFMDGSTLIGSGSLNASSVASFTTSSLSSGTHSMVAAYLGDANNEAANSSPLSQVVNSKPVTTVRLVSSSNPSTFGNPVTFTANLSSSTGGIPTGSVAFFVGDSKIGTSPVSAGVASFPFSGMTVGTHTVSATYEGDANDPKATASISQTVEQDATTLTLTSSVNPSVSGEAVTFTATLNPSYGLAGGESVTFSDGHAFLGTGTLSFGVATFTTSGLSVGLHEIRASYAGDVDREPVTSAPLAQKVGN